jgi:integrase
MVKRRVFTDPFIRALRPKAASYKLAEHAPKGEGRLVVRVLPSGTKEFFYRYRDSGQDTTLALGRFDHTGRNGKTLAGIRKALRESRELQRETGDVKAHRQAEERKQDAEARRGSLEQLCTAYVDHLKARNAPSAGEAELILRRHVLKPFPMLAKDKANNLEPADVQRILARMVNAGLTRQVNKARSYLAAAFAYGGKADHDPRTVARDGVLFALKANPVTLVPVIREYERTGERALSEDELRLYWLELDALPIAQQATLRFNLALACQRPTQLLRADAEAFDFSEKTLLLRDSKGRGGSRDHLLPLTTFALEQLQPLRELNGAPVAAGELAPPLFSSDGKRSIVVETLSDAVRTIAKRLKRSHKVPKFGQRDLRRTAETMLQKMGVDKEVRAHLLSHGRSKGVQGKHYERYDFLNEKRAALEKWTRHLERIITGKSAKVVAITGAAA